MPLRRPPTHAGGRAFSKGKYSNIPPLAVWQEKYRPLASFRFTSIFAKQPGFTDYFRHSTSARYCADTGTGAYHQDEIRNITRIHYDSYGIMQNHSSGAFWAVNPPRRTITTSGPISVPQQGRHDVHDGEYLPFPMRMGILGSTAAGKRHQTELASLPGTTLYPVSALSCLSSSFSDYPETSRPVR